MTVLPTVLAWTFACGARPDPVAEAPPEPTRFAIHVLWLEEQGEEHRDELERFQDCLLEHSSFADYWGGRVRFERAGTWVVPPPEGLLRREDAIPGWLEPLLEAAEVPDPAPGVTPIYLVYAHARSMQVEACGTCDRFEMKGRPATLALVRTGPSCWPAQGPVRSMTQFTQHELSCAVELALGEDHCAADGTCEGRATCPKDCSVFTGLSCPGAPEASYTGCDGNPVRGWVVQKLSHRGEGTEACDLCAPCDFVVQPRP